MSSPILHQSPLVSHVRDAGMDFSPNAYVNLTTNLGLAPNFA